MLKLSDCWDEVQGAVHQHRAVLPRLLSQPKWAKLHEEITAVE